jgi:hypothetical protein
MQIRNAFKMWPFIQFSEVISGEFGLKTLVALRTVHLQQVRVGARKLTLSDYVQFVQNHSFERCDEDKNVMFWGQVGKGFTRVGDALSGLKLAKKL